MLCCMYVSFQKANRLHITKTEIYVIFCTRVNIKLKKCVTVLIYDGLQRLYLTKQRYFLLLFYGPKGSFHYVISSNKDKEL